MNFCEFCHQPCGEQGYCDEVCYQEHQDELRDCQRINVDGEDE